MAYTPTGDRNIFAAMKRIADRAWFGTDVSRRAQLPLALSGEPIIGVNAANNGTVQLIGSDANDQVSFPLQVAIPISAAQIQAMFTTPVTLVPAPGPGFALVLEGLVLEFNRTGVAYTGGGVIYPAYAGAQATWLTQTSVGAGDLTTAGAGQTVRYLGPPAAAGGMLITPNAAIQLTNGTASFATGTGTIKAFITYSLVTL